MSKIFAFFIHAINAAYSQAGLQMGKHCHAQVVYICIYVYVHAFNLKRYFYVATAVHIAHTDMFSSYDYRVFDRVVQPEKPQQG